MPMIKRKKKYTATNKFHKRRERDGDLPKKKKKKQEEEKNSASALQIHQSYQFQWISLLQAESPCLVCLNSQSKFRNME